MFGHKQQQRLYSPLLNIPALSSRCAKDKTARSLEEDGIQGQLVSQASQTNAGQLEIPVDHVTLGV